MKIPKWHISACVFLISAAVGSVEAVEKVPVLRVLPAGDSITCGVGGSKAGYRYFLEQALLADGFRVDYLGTTQDNPCDGLRDRDHCGYNGLCLKGSNGYNVHDKIRSWLGSVSGVPHVILLHIGTNDAKEEVPLTDRPQALSETLDTIAELVPSADVIVTTVLKRTDNADWDENIRTNYSDAVEGIVAAHAAKGEKVHFLDMRAKLSYPDDLGDGLHPVDSGYRKMATAWYDEIVKLYGPSAEEPPPDTGFRANVPKTEWNDYTCVYDFAPSNRLTAAQAAAIYKVDRSDDFAGIPFDRVAYYMELRKTESSAPQYIWVSFDAMTDDLKKFGLPAPGTAFQCGVARMNVFSNVATVPVCTNSAAGGIEFWPDAYGQGEDGAFDCHDTRNGGGYGSMQIHDLTHDITLFSYSGWLFLSGNGGLGIGPNPNVGSMNDPDWTFAGNVTTYVERRIQVFARLKGALPETSAAAVTGAVYEVSTETITVSFSGGVVPADVIPARFDVPGFRIRSCSVTDNGRSVALKGWAETEGATTVTVHGLHDSSGLEIAAAALPVTLTYGANGLAERAAQTIADEVSSLIGAGTTAGYELLFAADIPTSCRVNDSSVSGYVNREWQTNSFYRLDRRTRLAQDDDLKTDRIAYCMVLVTTGGETRYIWTAMDAFTQDIAQMAVPEVGYYFAQRVKNLDVICNVSGVANVTGSDTGNIEFSASGWNPEKNTTLAEEIGGTDNFDWNDSGFTTTPGNLYGGMQVHNWGDRRTLWALNRFNNGNEPNLGIGGAQGGGDWTLSYNVNDYTSRRLYGFVLRSASGETRPKWHPDYFAEVDEAAEYSLIYKWAIPEKGVGRYLSDLHEEFDDVFDRIAYCLELVDKNGVQTWAWASMKAFTTDLVKLGVPSKENGAFFQQAVKDMNVYASSNVAERAVAEGGVTTGKHITTGNIEIWPSNFERKPGISEFGGAVDGSGNPVFDWNDSGGNADGNGFSQLQVNNYGARHTILSVSGMHFNYVLGIGIGNNVADVSNLDWTMSQNANNYGTRTMYIMVRKRVPVTCAWGEPVDFVYESPDTRAWHGESVTLRVSASCVPRSWQWFKDDTPLAGETKPYITLPRVSGEDEGRYTCLVSTLNGASFSRDIRLTVRTVGSVFFVR